jgi:hypothetical protein
VSIDAAPLVVFMRFRLRLAQCAELVKARTPLSSGAAVVRPSVSTLLMRPRWN